MMRGRAFVDSAVKKLNNPFIQILFIFISTRTILALQLGDCTAFAPDELSYLKILILTDKPNLITSDLPWAELPRIVRIVVFLPALALHKLGIDYLIAFRLQTIFYSAFAIFCFYFLVRELVKSVSFENRAPLEINKKSKAYLALIVFMPTTVVWSTLGLREPFLYLASGVIALAFSRLSDLVNSGFRLKWVLILFIGLEILAVTKLYLFLIAAFSLMIALIFSKRMLSKAKLAVLIPILVAIIIQGPSLEQIFEVSLSSNSSLDYSSPKLKKISVSIESLRECKTQNQGGPIIRLLGNLVIDNNQADPNSSFTNPEIIPATDYETSINRYQLNPTGIPMGLISFLLFPVKGDSFGVVSTFGILESIFWVPIYIILGREIYFSRKRRTPYHPVMKFLFFFIIIFTVFSAATEVNFGTAIRHRSILLLPIITLTSALYIGRRREETAVSKK